MTEETAPGYETSRSRRFNALVYSLFAAFVVFLTASYFLEGPIMNWIEAVIRKWFL